MFSKLVTISLLCSIVCAIKAGSQVNKSSAIEPTFEATNNTLVPADTYIVSAVECLKEAYEVYDNDEQRAALYATLFEEKYNSSWSVLIGYDAFYVHSKIYIEILVDDGNQNFVKESTKEKLFLILSDD